MAARIVSARAGIGGAHAGGLSVGGELEKPLIAIGNHRGGDQAPDRAARQIEAARAGLEPYFMVELARD